MTPRYADVQWALQRFPGVTDEERRTLLSWYRDAPLADLMKALSDPAIERQMGQLRLEAATDEPWFSMREIMLFVAGFAITLAVAALA